MLLVEEINMIGVLSLQPFYSYTINNWQEVKEKIKNNIKYSTFERDESFISDRKDECPFYSNNIADILKETISEFANEISVSHVTIKNMWAVKYEKGDYHPVHNHSGKGYSAILYLDYDQDVHTQTFYVHPMNDPVSDKTIYSAPPAKEGDIVFVPSNILHFTKPNASDKERVILSFDMDVFR